MFNRIAKKKRNTLSLFLDIMAGTPGALCGFSVTITKMYRLSDDAILIGSGETHRFIVHADQLNIFS